MSDHRMVDRGYGGGGNWVRCSCGWEGGPFEGHKMLPMANPPNINPHTVEDAAPEMLAALRLAKEHLADCWQNHGGGSETLAIVEAAIAKATGQ